MRWLVSMIAPVMLLSAPTVHVCAAEVTGVPRIALVYSAYGDFRHRDDYDKKMKRLGWPMDKYENKELSALGEKLGEYDIILGTALYNLSNVQDFSIYKDELFRFMERGGAIVLTDTNYVPHVNWLEKWGPDWEVKAERCKQIGTPMKWLDATHLIFNSAHVIRKLGPTWSHVLPGEGWRVLSTCEDEQATGLFRARGRGFMMLTCQWGYSTKMLENVWGALQCYRAGLAPTAPDLAGFGLGDNTAKTTVENLTDEPLQFAMVIEVRDPSGKAMEYRAEVALPGREKADADVTIPLAERGAYRMTTRFYRDGREFSTAPTTDLVIPNLLTIEVAEPKYRGNVYLAKPVKSIRFHGSVHLFKERLEDLSFSARLGQGEETLAELPARSAPGLEFEAVLPLEGAEAGAMTLEVELRERGGEQPVALERKDIRVLPPREPQVFIDEDLNMRVNGELFFPIAVYHIPAKDFARAREMGFNSIQAWGTKPEQAKANLDAAEQHGLRVILEGVTHAAKEGDPKALDPAIEAYESHPALLAWYLTDEPSGDERFAWCERVYAYLREKDPHHPVFMTSCSPGEFGRFAWVTDIFAVDPYPIPRSVVMVSSWMKRAQEAVEGRKPVWLIPQLHNWSAYRGDPKKGRGPTPEEERNMVYQGLIWGAKAIFYYPWDDRVTGLVYDETLMEAIKGINAELAVLGPELLKREHEVVAQNDEAHPNLYAAVYRGEGVQYVIAASVSDETATLEAPAPGLADGELEVMFEGRKVRVEKGVIRDEFGPLEVHVYRTQ